MVSHTERRNIIIDEVLADLQKLGDLALISEETVTNICVKYGCTARKAQEYLKIAGAKLMIMKKQIAESLS